MALKLRLARHGAKKRREKRRERQPGKDQRIDVGHAEKIGTPEIGIGEYFHKDGNRPEGRSRTTEGETLQHRYFIPGTA